MKSKLLKGIFIGVLILSSTFISACKNNTSVSENNSNTNVKEENQKDDNTNNSNEENIILIDNDKISSVLSETTDYPELAQAVINELNLSDSEAEETKYYYNKVDLNSDENDEVFVELAGPYTSGTGGNTAIIFKDENGGLSKVSKFTLIRSPIIIGNEKTNGWNDIIVELSDEGAEKEYVVLKYDGNTYPDVNQGEKVSDISNISGTAIIADDMSKENVKSLYLKK